MGEGGLMRPPWIESPDRLLAALFGRQRSGEWYVGRFRAWWDAQPVETRARVAVAFPALPGWDGFWAA
jgi:hypothetical protein